MWSTWSMISLGRGPWGACRTSQCLSRPGWRLKLGQRGARRPANLRANCGAGVNGEWQAGGAMTANNGRLILPSVPPDKEEDGRTETTPSMKSSASLAFFFKFLYKSGINQKWNVNIYSSSAAHLEKFGSPDSGIIWVHCQSLDGHNRVFSFYFFILIVNCHSKKVPAPLINLLSDEIIQKRKSRASALSRTRRKKK